MAQWLSILIGMILVNNYVLAQFLGICPFLGVSKKLDSAVGMGVAPTVQPYRTATAASAITAVVTILLCVTSPANSEASSAVTALIIAMFAHSEHHCSATLPAIYFLLSGTAPMSRLLIIIRKSPAFRWPFS